MLPSPSVSVALSSSAWLTSSGLSVGTKVEPVAREASNRELLSDFGVEVPKPSSSKAHISASRRDGETPPMTTPTRRRPLRTAELARLKPDSRM
jgi:hypothetical protein